MKRLLAVLVVTCLGAFANPHAGELPSDADPDVPKAKGIIIEFENWPPDRVTTAPLVRKLRAAGLRRRAELPLFKSWVFEWEELQEARRAENFCFELALDERTSSLFASCTPDALLRPARLPRPPRSGD